MTTSIPYQIFPNRFKFTKNVNVGFKLNWNYNG